jgi:hypothetical protein
MVDETPPAGVNPDKWLKHRAIYSASQIDMKEATTKNQAVLKAAKSDGVHIDALKFVSGLDKKDPLEGAAFLRALLEGALIQKCAFMFQGDMLNGGSIADMLKVQTASPAAIEKFDNAVAHERGYAEGLHGGSLDNLAAEFGAGTSALQAASTGFKRGRQFMEGSQPKGVKAVSAAKGRRGGRAKAQGEPSEPEPAMAAPVASGDIDMIKVQAMSNTEMAAYWTKITGEAVLRFESKEVGLRKFSALYAAQATSAEARAVN